MINQLLSSIEFCNDYNYKPPFSPSEKYPEYPFDDYSRTPNLVYKAIRNHFVNLQLDKKNFGSKNWNPFDEFDLVNKLIVIKPNWVIDRHPLGENIWSVITHPSIIRVILDYIFVATKGNCEVIIGDSPLQQTDFNKIIELSKINDLISYFHKKGLNIKIEDFRLKKAICDDKNNIIKTISLSNNSNKAIAINLFSKSLHSAIDYSYKKYRVPGYDKREVRKHHKPGYHEYLISNTVIKSDFFINLPKMKIHRRAGVTLSMKNLIGINCAKDWLPHHRRGAKSKSSDEYKKSYLFQSLSVYFNELALMNKNTIIRKILIFISRIFNKIHKGIRTILKQEYYSEGSWYGNDTIWRTCLDINKILFYSDKKGNLKNKKFKRNYLTIIDGIIGGEKEAPLTPSSINSSITIAAFNPAVADFVATKVMGIDPNKLQIVRNSFIKDALPIFDKCPDEIIVRSSKKNYNVNASSLKIIKKFEAPLGWKGHMEIQKDNRC